MSSATVPHPTDGARVTPIITQEEISERVSAMGAQIRADYGNEEITLLCILKGSLMFTADLCRAITGPVNLEFLGVASYQNETHSSGAVQITHDLTTPIADRHVLIVEDIVDTGLTLNYLMRVLKARQPRSLKVAALLEKPAGNSPVHADYTGFVVGDEFVVGYGLDWAQRFRNLPFIGKVEL